MTVIKNVMLTTTDNPYNPFTQFDEWLAYDTAKGYNTCGLLARIAHVSESLSIEEYETALVNAIDEIISLNILGIYTKVTREEML